MQNNLEYGHLAMNNCVASIQRDSRPEIKFAKQYAWEAA